MTRILTLKPDLKYHACSRNLNSRRRRGPKASGELKGINISLNSVLEIDPHQQNRINEQKTSSLLHSHTLKMQLKLLIILSALATHLMATPLTARDTSDPGNGHIELYREDASSGDGKLIYYGHGDSGINPRADTVSESTGSCTPSGRRYCGTYKATDKARNDDCNSLLQELQAYPAIPIGISPRQICYMGSSDTFLLCCVSWSNPIPGLKRGDLSPIVNESKRPIYKTHTKAWRSLLLIVITYCITEGIKGSVADISIEQVCTRVCVDKDGTICS